jgi:hypothetical protein
MATFVPAEIFVIVGAALTVFGLVAAGIQSHTAMQR